MSRLENEIVATYTIAGERYEVYGAYEDRVTKEGEYDFYDVYCRTDELWECMNLGSLFFEVPTEIEVVELIEFRKEGERPVYFVHAANELDTMDDIDTGFAQMCVDAGGNTMTHPTWHSFYGNGMWNFRFTPNEDISLDTWLQNLKRIWSKAMGDVDMNVGIYHAGTQIRFMNIGTGRTEEVEE